MPSFLLPVLAFGFVLALLYVRGERQRGMPRVELFDSALRAYVGGMRWEPDMNATFPFARLTISAGGITAGPSASFVPLVPTLAFRWAELTRIEPVGWRFLPFIADGVRFSAADACFIFWTGSSWRTAKVLDLCESASGRPVSRMRQPAPLHRCR